ncbi:hypothetical protein BDB00DRAFT_878682 [Zychaea mexicana]|uniref:uncharacterized protein n=1 Tax=Zychaea mexicana TaxID=64656 RepID=UPI0022FE10AE|nr:uncharacterized protein BDB00DRAFT_878682 [Zychaea mexicana]KAI9484552.1 hypothetical protein BDB00DRAFT_878682 [Zychaea mexicana]
MLGSHCMVPARSRLMNSNEAGTSAPSDQQPYDNEYNDLDDPVDDGDVDNENDNDDLWQDTDLIQYWDAALKGYKSYYNKEDNPAVLIPAPKKRSATAISKQQQKSVTGKRKRVSFDLQKEQEGEEGGDDGRSVPETFKAAPPQMAAEEEQEYAQDQPNGEEYHDQQQQHHDDYNNYYYYYDQQQQQPQYPQTAPPPPPPPPSFSGTSSSGSSEVDTTPVITKLDTGGQGSINNGGA